MQQAQAHKETLLLRRFHLLGGDTSEEGAYKCIPCAIKTGVKQGKGIKNEKVREDITDEKMLQWKQAKQRSGGSQDMFGTRNRTLKSPGQEYGPGAWGGGRLHAWGGPRSFGAGSGEGADLSRAEKRGTEQFPSHHMKDMFILCNVRRWNQHPEMCIIEKHSKCLSLFYKKFIV